MHRRKATRVGLDRRGQVQCKLWWLQRWVLWHAIRVQGHVGQTPHLIWRSKASNRSYIAERSTQTFNPYYADLCTRKFEWDRIYEMLKVHVVEPSDTEWCASIRFAAKKYRSLHFWIDYRKVNSVTVNNFFLTPMTDECINALGGAWGFSKLYARSEYCQTRVDEKGRKKRHSGSIKGYSASSICHSSLKIPLRHFKAYWTSYPRRKATIYSLLPRRHYHISEIDVGTHLRYMSSSTVFVRHRCQAQTQKLPLFTPQSTTLGTSSAPVNRK